MKNQYWTRAITRLASDVHVYAKRSVANRQRDVCLSESDIEEQKRSGSVQQLATCKGTWGR